MVLVSFQTINMKSCIIQQGAIFFSSIYIYKVLNKQPMQCISKDYKIYKINIILLPDIKENFSCKIVLRRN